MDSESQAILDEISLQWADACLTNGITIMMRKELDENGSDGGETRMGVLGSEWLRAEKQKVGQDDRNTGRRPFRLGDNSRRDGKAH